MLELAKIAQPFLITGEEVVTYLLRDEFNGVIAAGSVNGTNATPGPGTRTVRDVESKLSISSGAAQLVAQATPVTNEEDLVYGDVAITRVAGRMLIASTKFSAAGYVYWAQFVDSQTPSYVAHLNVEFGFYLDNNYGSVFVPGNNYKYPKVGGIANATTYYTCTVLRAAGAYSFIKGGAFTYWTLLYYIPDGSDGTLYASTETYSATFAMDFIRVPDVLWLPTPLAYDTFTRSNGAIGTSEASGA